MRFGTAAFVARNVCVAKSNGNETPASRLSSLLANVAGADAVHGCCSEGRRRVVAAGGWRVLLKAPLWRTGGGGGRKRRRHARSRHECAHQACSCCLSAKEELRGSGWQGASSASSAIDSLCVRAASAFAAGFSCCFASGGQYLHACGNVLRRGWQVIARGSQAGGRRAQAGAWRQNASSLCAYQRASMRTSSLRALGWRHCIVSGGGGAALRVFFMSLISGVKYRVRHGSR